MGGSLRWGAASARGIFECNGLVTAIDNAFSHVSALETDTCQFYFLGCFSNSDRYCFTMATSSGSVAYFRYSRNCAASFVGSCFAS